MEDLLYYSVVCCVAPDTASLLAFPSFEVLSEVELSKLLFILEFSELPVLEAPTELLSVLEELELLLELPVLLVVFWVEVLVLGLLVELLFDELEELLELLLLELSAWEVFSSSSLLSSSLSSISSSSEALSTTVLLSYIIVVGL